MRPAAGSPRSRGQTLSRFGRTTLGLAWVVAIAAAPDATSADGVFHGVELLRFKHKQGTATQLLAQRARQLPRDDAWRVEQLQLRGLDAHGAPWQLSAATGELRSGDALQLRGDVVMEGRGPDGAALHLNAPQLLLQLERQHGSGDGLLELRWGNRRLRGYGFEFSLAERWLQLSQDTQSWIGDAMATQHSGHALELRADSARWEWRPAGHLLRYDGRVHYVDEALELHAKQLSLRHREDDAAVVQSAVATGDPVHFRHTTTELGKVVDGYARHIEYDRQQQRIVLRGGARLQHGKRWLEGARIDYHEATMHAVATGTPARFHHMPTGHGKVVDGQARRIEYDHRLQRIVLQDAARLRRDERWLESERIDYHLPTTTPGAAP